MRSARKLTRRRALRALAGTATAAVSGCIKVDTSIGDPPYGPDETAEYRLAGTTASWLGLDPPLIEGIRNPGIEVVPGQTVEITWVNRDGNTHQFIVADSSRNVLAKTEPASEEGTTRTVTFEARQEMMQYYCDYHPAQMRGTLLVTSE